MRPIIIGIIAISLIFAGYTIMNGKGESESSAKETVLPTSAPTLCPCMHEMEPICCDGRSFDAPCWAECAGYHDPGKECTIGACKQPTEDQETPCICTMEYAPVCCDGKSFSNSCEATCAGFDPKGAQCVMVSDENPCT